MAKSPRRQYLEKDDIEHVDSLLAECVVNEHSLTDWESEFLNDMLKNKDRDKLWKPTQTQYDKIKELSEKEYDPVW